MAKKKKIIKKTPTRVHSFRCTDKDWKELKKKIMMVVGACIFLIAAAQALPLFFGIGG